MGFGEGLPEQPQVGKTESFRSDVERFVAPEGPGTGRTEIVIDKPKPESQVETAPPLPPSEPPEPSFKTPDLNKMPLGTDNSNVKSPADLAAIDLAKKIEGGPDQTNQDSPKGWEKPRT